MAGIYHETNTFVPGRTRLGDFSILEGDLLWSAAGQESPLAGALETAEALRWEVVPAVDLRAMPGGMVDDEVVELWWNVFEKIARSALARGPLAGIFLVLHGAMVSESHLDVEGELLARIRSLPGLSAVPLGGVTDLHANFSAAMARHSDALLTYRRNPHTDAKQRTMDAAYLLNQCMETGRRPATVWLPARLILAPTATGTTEEPMRSLQRIATRIEDAWPSILAVNVHAGFAFADTPATGVSFSAITLGDQEDALRELVPLAAAAREMHGAGEPREHLLPDALQELQRHLASNGDGPVLLIEPSDNIGAGAPGDGVTLLRALVEVGIGRSAVIINDPEAVARLSRTHHGDTCALDIGGKSNPLYGGPCLLDVEFLRRTDGRFRLQDPYSHLASMAGAEICMGPCAVVRHHGMQVLLTSKATAPFDLGQWRSQGILPEELAVIGIKAAVAHRRAYDPIAKASIYVLTPGPCSSDIATLPYRHVSRPVSPLDAIQKIDRERV